MGIVSPRKTLKPNLPKFSAQNGGQPNKILLQYMVYSVADVPNLRAIRQNLRVLPP